MSTNSNITENTSKLSSEIFTQAHNICAEGYDIIREKDLIKMIRTKPNMIVKLSITYQQIMKTDFMTADKIGAGIQLYCRIGKAFS